MPQHKCHVPTCPLAVAPKMLMCRRHWYMVPVAARREVWRHYRKGQETDRRPSPEYLMAARAAIKAVVDKESGGQPPLL